MDTFGISLIKRHEGLRLKPYRCPSGKLTIGWGRNLEDRGIDELEAERLFDRDWHDAEDGATTLVKNWNQLSQNRKSVLVDMVFQMGLEGVKKFQVTLFHIENENFQTAAFHMRNSLWAKQTPERAEEDAKLMEEG